MKLSEPLISLDPVSTKPYCLRAREWARVHFYYCFYIIFSANPVRRPVGLRDRGETSWVCSWKLS